MGAAIAFGTYVALKTADAAILCNRVTDMAGAIRLARVTMANIRQNAVIALGPKAALLVTAILGITGLWIVSLANTGTTVLVTLNALRQLHSNPGRMNQDRGEKW